MEWDEALRVLASLQTNDVDYVLIGGVALNMHGLVRATEDMDIFIRPTKKNIARLRQALHALYRDPSIDEITHEALTGEYPAIRYCPPEGGLYFDILARLGEFASFDDLKVQEIRVGDTTVRVAAPETLYWLKKDTIRLQDRADAEKLRQRFDLKD